MSVTAIYGRRGSGKTTRAILLLRSIDRVIVFDPIGEYAKRSDYSRVDRWSDLRDALRLGYARRRFRIAFVPSGDFPATLHHLARAAWEAQRLYELGRLPKLCFLVEEANLGYPASRLSPELWGMSRLTLQGRHRGVDVMAVTQRPAGVSADFRGQVDAAYIFPLSQDLDRRAVLELLGKEHEGALKQLAPHSYLCWKDGAVTRGRNSSPRS